MGGEYVVLTNEIEVNTKDYRMVLVRKDGLWYKSTSWHLSGSTQDNIPINEEEVKRLTKEREGKIIKFK